MPRYHRIRVVLSTLVFALLVFYFSSSSQYIPNLVQHLVSLTVIDRAGLTSLKMSVMLRDNKNYTLLLRESNYFDTMNNLCVDNVIKVQEEGMTKFYHILFQATPEKLTSCSTYDPTNHNNRKIEGRMFYVDNMLGQFQYYWVILPALEHMFCDKAPKWKDVVYLPSTYSHAENAGHFLLDLLPYYYTFVKTSQKYLPNHLQHLNSKPSDTANSYTTANSERKPDSVFLSPQFHLHPQMIRKNMDFIRGLGISEVIFHQGKGDNYCFRYAFTGPKYQKKIANSVHTEVSTHFKQHFNVTLNFCQRNVKTFVMIQRNGSRKILNIEELVMVAKMYGYQNVQIVFLEQHSVAEQMQIIYCADALLGIQGSGMVWYKYLPPGAIYIEVGYEHWSNHFFTDRAKDRKDLKLYNMQCSGVVSDNLFLKTAKEWFNYAGNLTDEVKEKVLTINEERSKMGHTLTIWMNSQCTCKPQLLENILAYAKSLYANPKYMTWL